MSIFPKETIEVIAQSMGMSNLSPDVSSVLAPDVEYRLREIMQESIKLMLHSKRTVLTAEDVDSALRLKNVEPIYGFASSDPMKFKKAIGHNDLFYIDDKELDVKDIINAPLPKAPLDKTVMAHWLAIEGVQPAIPENPPPEALAHQPEKKSEHVKEEGPPVDFKLPVKHVLSRELQIYFDKITELISTMPQSMLFKEALVSLATDSGLHPLVPYFSYFIADEVSKNLKNLNLLIAIMRVVQSLLRNPHVHLEPYLHQLMPSMITCIVAKRLGHRFVDNHWGLRDFSANLVASVCQRFGHAYHNLQLRVTRTLLQAFLDPTKAMTQHYGAIQGLAALGPSVVRLLILPNLQSYLQLLEPEMLLEKQKNEMKRSEAWRVYGALLHAAGQCLRERFKEFPYLLSPPGRSVWKINHRVVMSAPNNKRKASMDISQQLPLKKVATDSSVGVKTADIQSAADGFHAASNTLSSSSGQIPNTNICGRGRKEIGVESQIPKASAVLPKAWKEDMDGGNLVSSLFEFFGESTLPFTQSAEMSFFL